MQLAVNFKVFLCDYILRSLFKDIEESLRVSTDALVVENCNLNNQQGVGFIVDGHQFIHSSVANVANLSFLQLNRSEFLVPHDEIIPKALKLLDYIHSQDIDRTRFKGLINGMLSVVKSTKDFDIVFHQMFTDEIQEFNREQDYKLCFSSTPPKLGSKDVTVTDSDIEHVNNIKTTFKKQYDRYRFMKEVIGI